MNLVLNNIWEVWFYWIQKYYDALIPSISATFYYVFIYRALAWFICMNYFSTSSIISHYRPLLAQRLWHSLICHVLKTFRQLCCFNLFRSYKIDFILLAGYLKLIPTELVRAYPKSIVNIHPSLLPAFGGKGYFGMKVHKAVIASGARYTSSIYIFFLSFSFLFCTYFILFIWKLNYVLWYSKKLLVIMIHKCKR